MYVYSFKDLSGAFIHPLVPIPLVFSGSIGVKSITVKMAGEKTHQDIAADGAIQSSYIPGDNGSVSIVCQQNSQTHQQLLIWYNLVKAAADLGNVSAFALGAMTLRSISAQTGHVITGISIPKLGDKPYGAQGADVTWDLPAASIQSI
jgi:hypothetical protein